MTRIYLKKKLLSIIGICLGCMAMGLVFTMVNTAIPAIRRSLGISLYSMQWMMTFFGMINCAMLVTSGRLADIYGRKKIFLMGLLCSGIGMILGGFCTGSIGLILCMSFAGLGNAVLLPVSQAMLVSEFPESQRSRAIAIWAAAIASSLAIGPLLGGVITQKLGWQWIFWSSVPVIFIALFFSLLFSTESKNMEDPPLVDYKGMVYLAVTLASFVLMIIEFNHFSWSIITMLLVLTLVSTMLLWKNEKKFPSPILLQKLIQNRTFVAASLASACLVFYIWSTFFLLPLYLQNVRHLSSLTSGLVMLGIAVPVVFLTPFIGKNYRPQTTWLWTLTGFLLLITSSLFQIFFQEDSSLLFISTAIVLFGIGYSFLFSPTATAAISIASKEQAGLASGTFVTIQEIGGSLGLALIVTYVRYYPDLLLGFQKGMQALLMIGAIGCFCGLLLKTSPSKSLSS